MPNGAHFQLVAELSKASLLKTVQAAYDQQIIPHAITPPTGLAMGPLTVADSEIRVPPTCRSGAAAKGCWSRSARTGWQRPRATGDQASRRTRRRAFSS
jgi:hypothetical protein